MPTNLHDLTSVAPSPLPCGGNCGGKVVAPLLGCAADGVAYQASPTLRVSYPSAEPMGHPHCDYEYHHQPCELNFW